MDEISTMTMSSTLSGKNPMSGVDSSIIPDLRQTTPTMTRFSATSQDVNLVQASSEDIQPITKEGLRKTVSILAIAPTNFESQSESNGATVFVGAGGTSSVPATTGCIGSTSALANWRQTCITEVKTVNGYGTNNKDQQRQLEEQQLESLQTLVGQCKKEQSSTRTHHSGQHVVKIRINPELDKSTVVSTIRLNPEITTDGSSSTKKNSVQRSFNENNGAIINSDNGKDEILWRRSDDVTGLSGRFSKDSATGQSENSCVRISVVSGSVSNDQQQYIENQRTLTPTISKSHDISGQQLDEMIQQRGTTTDSINTTSMNRGGACFYYGSFPNSLTSIVMSSGHSSPSDTLDSGTCSDLDGTPPPLPKKKNSSTVLLGVTAVNGAGQARNDGKIVDTTVKQQSHQQQQHKRSGSVTSSCPELDSDDNESNISCDSLNNGEVATTIVDNTNIRVNGIAVVAGDDDKIGKIVNHEMLKKNEDSDDMNVDKTVTSGDDSSVKVDIAAQQCQDINDNDNHSGDIKNNNNNNSNNNNNNNIGNNKDEEATSLKVIKSSSNVDEEMNERNNGKSAAGSNNEVLAEMITASGSSEITPTSPCVSPSTSVASSLSKASSTPRVRSPVSNGHVSPVNSTTPMVRECTYEDRKLEQTRINEETAAADYYANYNRKTGTKYLYDDDRFYKFHINENKRDNDCVDDDAKIAEKESDEFFAGYKIHDREAIRSAKGTVRGVKNRVRAGIATFLQKPSTKNYKTKDAGKIVVYTTSMSIVRETYFACIKMLQMLKTHMVKHEVRDMFMSRELQIELKERIGCETIEVPQLFIDGQYIGNADAVERLNESGELRRMFKPYKSPDACTTCNICGGCRLLPCQICNGSKKSPVRNDFMKEFYWLRCMNCDEVGLVQCQNC